MKPNPKIPKPRNRRSIRLPDYDYSQDGGYFITICTHDRECFFGDIVRGEMVLNDAGNMAKEYWLEIPKHYPNVVLGEFVVMPNHVHGILTIKTQSVPIPVRQNKFQKIIPGSIGSIVRGYKIGVTKWFRKNTEIHTVWQRNYYEHIIRDETSLNRIQEYIIHNPINWERDKEMGDDFII